MAYERLSGTISTLGETCETKGYQEEQAVRFTRGSKSHPRYKCLRLLHQYQCQRPVDLDLLLRLDRHPVLHRCTVQQRPPKPHPNITLGPHPVLGMLFKKCMQRTCGAEIPVQIVPCHPLSHQDGLGRGQVGVVGAWQQKVTWTVRAINEIVVWTGGGQAGRTCEIRARKVLERTWDDVAGVWNGNEMTVEDRSSGLFPIWTNGRQGIGALEKVGQ